MNSDLFSGFVVSTFLFVSLLRESGLWSIMFAWFTFKFRLRGHVWLGLVTEPVSAEQTGALQKVSEYEKIYLEN